MKKSPDCLSDPDLVFENVARVKRLIDMLKYSGPVALAGDCTKVRKCLTFSNDYGSHVLGAALPLEECAVKDRNDIENFVSRVSESNDFASQVRAILVKVSNIYLVTYFLLILAVNRSLYRKSRLLSSHSCLQRATTT